MKTSPTTIDVKPHEVRRGDLISVGGDTVAVVDIRRGRNRFRGLVISIITRQGVVLSYPENVALVVHRPRRACD